MVSPTPSFIEGAGRDALEFEKALRCCERRRGELADVRVTSSPVSLHRETFRTDRTLEYFSEKELTLQTGHEPERWPEVVLKELVDNSLDACEQADRLPEITVTLAAHQLTVDDNGPGIDPSTVRTILDYATRTSSKDAYISPTRGAQGNALKTVLAIPYVLGGGQPATVSIVSRGECHTITVAVDHLAQVPHLTHTHAADATCKDGTRVVVNLSTLKGRTVAERFLQLVQGYSLLNPHATFTLAIGRQPVRRFERRLTRCQKWRSCEPTSAHWYTVEQFRALIRAYITAERHGGRARTVREFIAEFRGLSGTAKQKAILSSCQVAGMSLRDLVRDGDVHLPTMEALWSAMRQASTPVKPALLGVLGDAHIRDWLTTYGGTAATCRYQRIADVDDRTGLPFVVEVAVAGRADDEGRRLLTGINFAPTLVDPFRAFSGGYQIGLSGLLGTLHAGPDDPLTVVVHLASPHLNYTDRGKSSLEAV